MFYQTLTTILADGLVVPVVLMGAFALLFRLKKGSRYQAYCRIVMAGLTAFLLAKLLGTLYQPSEARPFELMNVAAGASYLNNPGFPSDHALFTAAITFAVWAESRAKWLTIICITLTALVCLGRVMALVHTPLDVLGGIAVAAVGAGWYFTALPVGKKRKA